MHLDVTTLNSFYYHDHLGAVATRALRTAIRHFWPDVRGETILGYGFATPFLRMFMSEASHVFALMPADQGALIWPKNNSDQTATHQNLVALSAENRMPLATGSINRIIVSHGLETSPHSETLLSELWRVLAPEGKIIFVIPNRTGVWARRDNTPFGVGRPFTFGQVENQLERSGFEPTRHQAALYFPPSKRRFFLRAANAIERIGQKIGSRLQLQHLAGVLLIEANKRVYVPPQRGKPAKARKTAQILGGLTNPVPNPRNSLHKNKTRRKSG